MDFNSCSYYIRVMIMNINEPVSVTLIYNGDLRKIKISSLKWRNRIYAVNAIDLHHYYRKGETLLHVFSISTRDLYFRLLFNTNNLSWIVEQIADGKPE